MKNKNVFKYLIIGFSLIAVIVVSFVLYTTIENNKIKRNSEWVLDSYENWVEDKSNKYFNKNAATEFLEYLIGEDQVDQKYLNYVYYNDKVIYLLSCDNGKNYLAYEIKIVDKKLNGDIKYLGSSSSLKDLLNKISVDTDKCDIYYETNSDGTSKIDQYTIRFNDFLGYKIKSEVVNDGKFVEIEYDCFNYKIDGDKTYGYEFVSWVCDGVEYESPIKVTKDMTLTAKVVEKEGLVNNGKKVYSTLEEAFEKCESGDTLVLMKDLTVDKLIIPEGITLLIPANNYNTSLQIPGDSNASKTPIMDDPFVTLTVNELTVNGELHIASVIGYPGSGGATQGHTSGKHGLLVVNDKLIVNGLLDASGYIKGNGKAEVYGTLNCPFIVRDFRGGSNTLGVYNNGPLSPFNVYELINVQIDTTYYDTASLVAYGNLYAASQYNIAKSPVIGEGGVVVLNKGATATIKYDSDKGKGTLVLDGGDSDGFFSLTVMGLTVTIEGVFFPLPYTFDVVLKKGIYNLNTSYKLLPGSTFSIMDDAVCNINNEFIVYSEFNDVPYSGSVYPSLPSGILEVYGTLNINHSFGGLITLKNNGKINVDSNAILELESIEGHATGQGKEDFKLTNTIKETAKFIKDGITTLIEAGKNYE